MRRFLRWLVGLPFPESVRSWRQARHDDRALVFMPDLKRWERRPR